MSGTYLTSDGGKSWKMYNFPGGSSAFSFDPADPEAVYVCGHGLHRTADWGKNWELLFPPSVDGVRYLGDHADFTYLARETFPDEPSISVNEILLDPADSRRIYLGVSRYSPSKSVVSIFYSADRGRQWAESAGLKSSVIGLFNDNQAGNEIFVFCQDALYKLDKTTHEIKEMPLPAGIAPLSAITGGLDPESKKMRFYAVTGTRWDGEKMTGGVYVSDDGARTWSQVTPPLDSGLPEKSRRYLPYFERIACSESDSRSVYLVCGRYIQKNQRGDLGHWYGIFKSADAGRSWQWVYKGGGGSSDYIVRDGWMADNERDSWVRDAFGGEYVRVIEVKVFPGSPEIALFTDWYRVMKTVDGGKSWFEVYSERLPDGSVRSRGMDVTTSYGVHFDPFNTEHLAISYTDIGYFHSFNSGQSWFRSVDGVPPAWDNTCYWMQFDPEIKDKLWSVWSSWHDIPRFKMIRMPGWQNRAVGGVCVSVDSGKSWKVSSDGLPKNSPTTCIALDPESPPNSRTLYISVYGKGVFRSVDDGKSWEKKNQGLRDNPLAWEITLAADRALYLVVTPDKTGSISAGREMVDGGVYRSADQAETWEKLDLPDGARFPNSLTPDPQNPGRLYLSCWADLKLGDIYGSRYDGYPEGMGSEHIIQVNGGVFVSEDSGKSWKSIFDKKAYVYGLAVDQKHPGRLYINTFNNAAYRSDDYGRSWKKIKGYDFYWGHRVIVDQHNPEMIYLTTFGGSVFYGRPDTD